MPTTATYWQDLYSSGLVVWITAQGSCAMRAAKDFAQQEKPRTA